MKLREETVKKIFLLPAAVGTIVFIAIPVFFSFFLSFCDWDLLSDITFVGFSNYKELLQSSEFALILKNTFVFSLSTTIIAIIIPLVLAACLNSKIRGAEFFKTAYFLPFVTPMIVIAIVWEWIFDPNFVLLNHILKLHINWLYDTKTAMLALILVSAWKLIGYNMVIFLSGFSTINQSLYEAAKIDGANPAKTFFKITLPLLSPTVFFVAIIIPQPVPQNRQVALSHLQFCSPCCAFASKPEGKESPALTAALATAALLRKSRRLIFDIKPPKKLSAECKIPMFWGKF